MKIFDHLFSISVKPNPARCFVQSVKRFTWVTYIGQCCVIFLILCYGAVAWLMAEDSPSTHIVCVNMICFAVLLCGPRTEGRIWVASSLLCMQCVDQCVFYYRCWSAVQGECSVWKAYLCTDIAIKLKSAQSCSFRVFFWYDMGCCKMFSQRKKMTW